MGKTAVKKTMKKNGRNPTVQKGELGLRFSTNDSSRRNRHPGFTISESLSVMVESALDKDQCQVFVFKPFGGRSTLLEICVLLLFFVEQFVFIV